MSFPWNKEYLQQYETKLLLSLWRWFISKPYIKYKFRVTENRACNHYKDELVNAIYEISRFLLYESRESHKWALKL